MLTGNILTPQRNARKWIVTRMAICSVPLKMLFTFGHERPPIGCISEIEQNISISSLSIPIMYFIWCLIYLVQISFSVCSNMKKDKVKSMNYEFYDIICYIETSQEGEKTPGLFYWSQAFFGLRVVPEVGGGGVNDAWYFYGSRSPMLMKFARKPGMYVAMPS